MKSNVIPDVVPLHIYQSDIHIFRCLIYRTLANRGKCTFIYAMCITHAHTTDFRIISIVQIEQVKLFFISTKYLKCRLKLNS